MVAVLAGCSTKTNEATPQRSSSGPPSTSPATAAQPVRLRIGSLPRIFDLVLYAAEQDGVFKKNNLQVEIVPFRSVVERNNAFLAGDLDGFVDSIYEAININNSRDYCRVVGHNLMANMFAIVTGPRSSVIDPAQLKGKEIATSTGTIMQYALDKLLAQAGLENTDVNYVNVTSMPLRLEMIVQGKLPAAIMTPPLSDQAIASGARLLMDDSRQLLAGPGLIFSNDALKYKSDGIRRFIQSWQETIKAVNADPNRYRALLVSTAQVPDSLAATYKVPVFPEVRLPSAAELGLLLEWMKAQGIIAQEMSYDQVVETKFLK